MQDMIALADSLTSLSTSYPIFTIPDSFELNIDLKSYNSNTKKLEDIYGQKFSSVIRYSDNLECLY